MNTQLQYEKLAKEYNLPPFEDLNHQFELDCIDEEDMILREIRKKIIDKLENYLKILEGLLRPELIIVDLHESNEFSDKEREQIWQLYKRMMFYTRYSVEIEIDETDEKTGKFIKKFSDEWSDLKKKLLPILSKIKQSWLKETELEQERGYVG